MELVQNILIVVYVIISLAVIVIAMMQSKDDSGVSSAITGNSGSFYEKNKGKTKEGMLKKWTIILGIIFVLLTVATGIIYGINN